MAFAEAANGRIAGHGADGGESMRHQRGLRAHTSRRGRGFTAGMAAANHDDVEFLVESSLHLRLRCGLLAEAGTGVKKSPFGGMFHVKHRQKRAGGRYLPMQKSRKITSRMSSTSTRPVRRPKRTGGKPQLLGQQILAGGDLAILGPPQGRQGLLQGMTVASARHQRRLGTGQKVFGLAGQRG